MRWICLFPRFFQNKPEGECGYDLLDTPCFQKLFSFSKGPISFQLVFQSILTWIPALTFPFHQVHIMASLQYTNLNGEVSDAPQRQRRIFVWDTGGHTLIRRLNGWRFGSLGKK